MQKQIPLKTKIKIIIHDITDSWSSTVLSKYESFESAIFIHSSSVTSPRAKVSVVLAIVEQQIWNHLLPSGRKKADNEHSNKRKGKSEGVICQHNNNQINRTGSKNVAQFTFFILRYWQAVGYHMLPLICWQPGFNCSESMPVVGKEYSSIQIRPQVTWTTIFSFGELDTPKNISKPGLSWVLFRITATALLSFIHVWTRKTKWQSYWKRKKKTFSDQILSKLGKMMTLSLTMPAFWMQ